MSVIRTRNVALGILVCGTASALLVSTSFSEADAAPGGGPAQVVALTNQARAANGCGPVKIDRRLTAAQKHSRDMVARHYFEHDTPEGVSFGERQLDEGYPDPGGENIAYGQRSAREVVDDWMHSPGHRRNILNCEFATIGVGLDSRGMYWTQEFGYAAEPATRR